MLDAVYSNPESNRTSNMRVYDNRDLKPDVNPLYNPSVKHTRVLHEMLASCEGGARLCSLEKVRVVAALAQLHHDIQQPRPVSACTHSTTGASESDDGRNGNPGYLRSEPKWCGSSSWSGTGPNINPIQFESKRNHNLAMVGSPSEYSMLVTVLGLRSGIAKPTI